MKKINSIFYGSRIIFIGLIFLVPIPLLLYVIKKYFHFEMWTYIIYSSLIIGIIIEGFFGIILIVELHQDSKIDKYTQKHRKIKIKLEDGRYECANCGNRTIKEQDKECHICNAKFEENNLKTIQEILKL